MITFYSFLNNDSFLPHSEIRSIKKRCCTAGWLGLRLKMTPLVGTFDDVVAQLFRSPDIPSLLFNVDL